MLDSISLRYASTKWQRMLLAPCQISQTVGRTLKTTASRFTPKNKYCGLDYLNNPRICKGLALTLEERQILSIQGLQPPRFKTQESQIQGCLFVLRRYTSPFDKYLYLNDLHDRNEKLYFRLLHENVNELMPIVYTPTVGLACQKLGLTYRRQRGLYITINDKGHVEHILRNWPEPNILAICVTDGERILGLGDLGCNGMGIPIGKLALYTALGRIMAHTVLPVMLDVGTNNQDLMEDILYLGLRRKRVTGAEYVELVDEFMEAVVNVFGQTTLVQFEDFSTKNALYFLEKYAHKYCTFNDDIQGTSAIGLAGFYSSEQLTGKNLQDNTYLLVGAGAANLGIAKLLVRALQVEGLSCEEAYAKVYMVDTEGLITTSHSYENKEHEAFAKDHEPLTDLVEIVEKFKPSILVGATGSPGIFTPKLLNKMAELNERPVIFALSNPTSKAECTAEQAYENTDGRAIFCTGSPSRPVNYNGKELHTGQANNAYIFPGIALGLIAARAHHCSEQMFITAAKEVGNHLDEEALKKGSIFPPLTKITEISFNIALKVIDHAFENNLASVYPEPTNKPEWLKKQLYDFNYGVAFPLTWEWPKPDPVKLRDTTILDANTF